MKKERYDAYSNYYYKIDKKKNRKTKVLSIFFIILSILIVVFFSISFSNFLVVAKIVNINTNYIYETRTLFALSLFETDKIDDAETKAKEIKKQGGAGYIYKPEDKIFVLSSIYDNKKDAIKVKTNLDNSGITSSIVEIELPKIDFKINLSSKSSKILNKGIELFYSNYKNLYNLTVSFDMNEIDFIAAKNNVNDLLQDNKQTVNEYINNFNQPSNIYILYVKFYLNRLNDILNDLLKKDETTNFSSEMKYSYCCVVNCYLNLFDEMQ